ncbi:MAG: site-2 protease family protein [Candidatus Omnitrophota bacterium]
MDILGFIASFALLIIAMTVHEFAHGWVAYKLGDPTAKYLGRLTLNPLAHIDLLGTIIMPLMLFIATSGRFVFGAAKPVPIDYRALRNPKRDIIWIGISGPLANFIFAFLLSILIRFIPLALFAHLILINVVLGVFNLLPIPPLDGSRIVEGLLPLNLAYRYMRIEPYGFIILMALIWLGALDFLIWPTVILIIRLLGINI